MRTLPQHWLREGFNFKLSAALCPEREARGEVRASNAGERESRAEAGGGQGYCDLGDQPGTGCCRPQGAQGGVGGPLGDARTPGPRLQGSLLFLRNPCAAPAARLQRGALAASPLLRARAARARRPCVFCPVTFSTL